jgi:hypothetical protein
MLHTLLAFIGLLATMLAAIFWMTSAFGKTLEWPPWKESKTVPPENSRHTRPSGMPMPPHARALRQRAKRSYFSTKQDCRHCTEGGISGSTLDRLETLAGQSSGG